MDNQRPLRPSYAPCVPTSTAPKCSVETPAVRSRTICREIVYCLSNLVLGTNRLFSIWRICSHKPQTPLLTSTHIPLPTWALPISMFVFPTACQSYVDRTATLCTSATPDTAIPGNTERPAAEAAACNVWVRSPALTVAAGPPPAHTVGWAGQTVGHRGDA